MDHSQLYDTSAAGGVFIAGVAAAILESAATASAIQTSGFMIPIGKFIHRGLDPRAVAPVGRAANA